ncbi:MAG: hypothetical protein F6K28_41125 [Microcoleus sp. SIO2G3]|nr:hypothetical protein [Microcoleus sp. SIO2G3]
MELFDPGSQRSGVQDEHPYPASAGQLPLGDRQEIDLLTLRQKLRDRADLHA